MCRFEFFLLQYRHKPPGSISEARNLSPRSVAAEIAGSKAAANCIEYTTSDVTNGELSKTNVSIHSPASVCFRSTQNSVWNSPSGNWLPIR